VMTDHHTAEHEGVKVKRSSLPVEARNHEARIEELMAERNMWREAAEKNAAALDALRRSPQDEDHELERLKSECCVCEKCGHVQAEPNWCHKCGHRTSMPDWAKPLVDAFHEREAQCEDHEAGETAAAKALYPILHAVSRGDSPEALLGHAVHVTIAAYLSRCPPPEHWTPHEGLWMCPRCGFAGSPTGRPSPERNTEKLLLEATQAEAACGRELAAAHRNTEKLVEALKRIEQGHYSGPMSPGAAETARAALAEYSSTTKEKG